VIHVILCSDDYDALYFKWRTDDHGIVRCVRRSKAAAARGQSHLLLLGVDLPPVEWGISIHVCRGIGGIG
jgi:hypothetical protein